MRAFVIAVDTVDTVRVPSGTPYGTFTIYHKGTLLLMLCFLPIPAAPDRPWARDD
jgi:hypothetical protein